MIITRKGASANHGVRAVEIEKFKVSVDPEDGEFLLRCNEPVRDFGRTNSRHTYKITIPLNEYVEMTKELAKNIKSMDDEDVIKELHELTVPFIRLGNILATRG